MTDTARWQHLYSLIDGSKLVTIADIGANPINPAPYQALLDAGLCRVVGFEPNKDAYDALMKTATKHETYFNLAAGQAGTRTLHLYPASGFSSLFPLDADALDHFGKFQNQLGKATAIDVDLAPLDSIDDLPPIDLLKMDVQGAELEIIKTGPKKLRHACAMILETRMYRIYDGEPTWRALDGHMARKGFQLHKFMSLSQFAFGNPFQDLVRMPNMRNQLLDGDAVYILGAKKFAKMTDAQLLKSAVLADAVFQSFDFALKCLGALMDRGVITFDDAAAYCQLLPPELRR